MNQFCIQNDKCVIGYGVVGKSTALAFNIKKYYTRHDKNITLEEISKCKFIFICLPTPTHGRCYTEDIRKTINMIDEYPNPNDRIFIIRSTVEPGFAKSMKMDNIVSNPEFLSEASWEQDTKSPWMIVIGADNSRYREAVMGLYRGRYKYSRPLETDNTTAEMIKYALNTFFATKVIFANEIFNITQKVGANYEAIKKALENSPWGSKNHFKIYYKGKRGLHGSCLPKDLEAFANFSDSKFFKTLKEINERIINE